MSDNKTSNETKTVKRGKTNGYSSAKLRAKRQQRFEDACDRQASHDCLTIQEKIEKARSRRGESKREIARLMNMAEESVRDILDNAPQSAAVTKKVAKKVAKKKAAK